jgi:hypothetical protein
MRSGTARWVLAAVLATGAGAGAAVAIAASVGGPATTIGDAARFVTSAVYDSTARLYVQAAEPAGERSFAVPAGGGVITSWSSTVFQVEAGGGTIALQIVRPLPGGSFEVIGSDSHTLPESVNQRRFVRYATRIPVTGGERLGIATSDNVWQGSDWPYTGATVAIGVPGTPTVGQTVATDYTYDDILMAAEAVVEPDADRDGYGDRTQDACPADATRQAAPCTADLAAGLAVSSPSVPVGGLTALAASAAAVSGAAAGASLTVSVPPEVEVVQAVGPGAPCSGTSTVTCPLGDVGLGATANAVVVVRGARTGAAAVSARVASSSTDPNAANDVATGTVTVTSAPAAAVRECVVPPLKGLTRTGASRLLRTFGCTLGKVTTRKARKGARGTPRVVSSSPKAGTRRAQGSRVALTLARPRR